MTYELHHGDCIEVMKMLPDNSVDSIVTDPPYGLGFMGKAWDALPPGEDWARECLRVLKPGGHLLAFGGTRTWHRLAVAVEDAGFEIRDSIAWLYGSGFPKNHNVGASAGSEWEGWGTALKPAFEPIVLARKPLGEKSVATNVLTHGTGALNIDASRIGDRFPANVSLDETQAAALNDQAGPRWNGGNTGRAKTAGAGSIFGSGQGKGADGIKKAHGWHDASSFFYVAKAPKKERPVVDGVAHPTVKPLSLMRWLVRLVTPAGGVVLDPFAGSGTTLEACAIEGLNCIAIEREAEYLPLIQARIDRQAAFDFGPST